MIPADENLTVAIILNYEAEISFPDGSFIYQDEENGESFYYPHRNIKNKDNEVHKRFPATKEGLYNAFKFLQ